MKKNIALITTIVACIISCSSCQKNGSDNLPASTDKVKTYTEDIISPGIGHSVMTFNLTYDANDRIISIASATDPHFKTSFSYNSANAYMSDTYSGSDQITEYFYYNNNRIDSTFQYNNTGDTSTEKFLYNSSGGLLKSFEYDFSTVTGPDLQNTTSYTSYDANGNVLKSEDTDGNVDIYDYYTDLVYVHPLIGPALIPTIKRYLMKTHTLTTSGLHIATVTYTYTFDSNNRMSTEKAVVDDGSVVIKTYTY